MVHACLLSHFSHVKLFAILSMGSSRQEYWSELPCPPPGDLPNPGIELVFTAWAGRFFTPSYEGNPTLLYSS